MTFEKTLKIELQYGKYMSRLACLGISLSLTTVTGLRETKYLARKTEPQQKFLTGRAQVVNLDPAAL